MIGSTELVEINGHFDVPAKIDTGADSSSIWASNIHIDADGLLTFSLFGPGSPYYTGAVLKRADYSAAVVRSATGEEQIRYRTHLTLKIAGRKIRARFNLSDRSRNNFPILIGKRTLKNRFYVDVSQAAITYAKNPQTSILSAELAADPQGFHRRYMEAPKPPNPTKSPQLNQRNQGTYS